MSGTLYLVPTPIGNLSDMTERALKTLAEADFVAAEDTRVTLKLLNHFDIKKELVSCHQHNEMHRSDDILDRLSAGESCALCTDAGTPAISDPGELLVARAVEMGIRVCPLPGACAAITALSASGLPTGRFCFEGFIPVGKSARRERLAEISAETRTLIFYEAPHKLKATLSDLFGAFGNRRITLARELTKLHEEIIRTDLSHAAEMYNDADPRGEYVLIVEGAAETELEPDDPSGVLRELLDRGLPRSEAVRKAAEITGCSKNELYRLMLELSDK